ncbi:UDP-N-acetylmuramoyl-L-alanine--D-glutamate ligase [Candidatus Babeliales bacterium]|nr:UDP-N-acetylmuramoyl-L-alanine--D-glutamate ligase [Candidatus Babeliales bacterium]
MSNNIDQFLHNKKIGVWGLGVVGKSVLEYLKNITPHVQIMDQKKHDTINVIVQTPENIQRFLHDNDIIIPSPGIVLHGYEQYAHKFVQELDIFSSHFKNKIIAVTGTAGKTTVTTFLQQLIPDAVAAGNIGHAMLNIISDPQPSTVVLELSSYQLQYAQNFAPDFALWTNFYPNHLDHHKTIEEYFDAKCSLLKNQTQYQIALLPCALIDRIKENVSLNQAVFLHNTQKPFQRYAHPVFYQQENKLILETNNDIQIIFDDMSKLPSTTFPANWITILATLYLNNINLTNVAYDTLVNQQHRVEYVTTFNNVKIYNDSKSTIWQSTQQALQMFPNQKIALCIGGLSKGADRTPLIEYVAQKNITLFLFGKEADHLSKICAQYNVPHYQSPTLENAVQLFKQHHTNFETLLFSPAGSSFDLFKDYKDRGDAFKKIISHLSLI